MNVHVSENALQVIRDQVKSGRFSSDAEVIEEALRLLKERSQPPRRLTEEEFQRHLVEIGLMSTVPDTTADVDDPDDQPILIAGEPLSETVLRERR